MKLAVIPARKGSVRIPGKNLKPFCGHPIIEYSIKAALDSKVFDTVMVSTDSVEIAAFARKAGAEVPFMRSSETSGNYATMAEVVLEVLECYKDLGIEFDVVGQIFATAPFITSANLKKAMEMLLSSNEHDAVLAVKQFSFPIQRAMHIVNKSIQMLYPENFNTRSQDLPKTFHDAGQFAIAYTGSFVSQKRFFCKTTLPFILTDMEVQDIDTHEDWETAEFKYRYLNSCKRLISAT